MTLSAIYNLASKEGIPKTKVGKEVRYSKNHFDVAKVVAEPEPPAEYTIAEAMAKFGMTRDQLYHYVKTYKITRTKRGKLPISPAKNWMICLRHLRFSRIRL